MKHEFGAIPMIYPIPMILVGTMVQDEPNFTLIGDCGIMGLHPPILSISLHEEHYSTLGIVRNGEFSLNIPDTDMLQKADYCGSVSGRDQSKSDLFEVFTGPLPNAPMIVSCPVNLACRVIKEFTIGSRHIFIGEVVQCYVSDDYVEERDDKRAVAQLSRLDPIIYALDNKYYSIGDVIGSGYQEGNALMHPAQKGETT
jgi:flavin reductase (DIM6/NTAB) family NADH-FMN oxidoreductase RutF